MDLSSTFAELRIASFGDPTDPLVRLRAHQAQRDEARHRLTIEAPALRRREVAALEKLAGIEKPEEVPWKKPAFRAHTVQIHGQSIDVLSFEMK